MNNKFKLGDRVRYYSLKLDNTDNVISGTINSIYSPSVCLLVSDEGYKVMAHYKQLRHLRKRKPKYLYIIQPSYSVNSVRGFFDKCAANSWVKSLGSTSYTLVRYRKC